ncbi:STAS domain-containing protein [Streptomyces virginiae]|uniref:STAS domain-containing protein n=1 Tax=Streptomyces virginiae TaxID=1961 RepID=UPI00382954F8
MNDKRSSTPVVVAAHGELDSDTLAPVERALTEAAASHAGVVFDASGLAFADSSVLSMLLRVHALTELRIAAPQRQLLRLLEMTGADQLLTLCPSVENAIGKHAA